MNKTPAKYKFPPIFPRIAGYILLFTQDKPILVEFFLFSFTTIFIQGVRFAINIWAAKSLGPSTMGIWNALSLILTYTPFIALGTLNAMNRDVPLFSGQNNNEQINLVQSTTLGVAIVTSLGVALLVFIISTFSTLDNLLKLSLLFLAFGIVAQMLFQYFQVVLKSTLAFRSLSKYQVMFALLLPFITVPLLVIWNLPGYILGQVITMFIVSWAIVKFSKISIRVRFNFSETKRLIKVGGPIMVAGVLFGLLTTVDRWIILAFLDAESLGHYTPVVMMLPMLMLLPTVIAQQMYPRMAQTYGTRQSIASLRPIVNKQIIMTLVVLLPLVFMLYLIMPWAIETFLPEYVLGIQASRIILIGVCFLPIASGFVNLLNTIDKQKFYLVVQIGTIGFYVCVAIALIKLGYGLNGVAISGTLTYMGYGLSLAIIGRHIITSKLAEEHQGK